MDGPLPQDPPTVRFVTFGCKVNQYDTQVLRERALGAGWREDSADPDVVVVNTCTVTAHGGAAARKAVRRVAREHPEARIFLTGCYAVSDPAEAAALPGVADVVGNDRKAELLRLFGAGDDTPFMEERVLGLGDRTRAYVKIQDGCPAACTYCIVPRVRPEVTSKSVETVVREVADLSAAGFREIVLTGIHLGAFDDGGATPQPLTNLMARLIRDTEASRLRLSSIEATEVTGELLDLIAGSGRIAPHLHLPLQSGSARVLRAMGRRYGPEGFLAVAARVRERIPGAALGTDLLVGFPGETDEDFANSLDILRRAKFMRTHVFPFSPRPGTPAAGMRPVPSLEIRRRARAAEEVAAALARDYAASLVGSRVTVLVETRRAEGRLTGLTGRYVRATLKGPDEWMGRLLPARVVEAVGAGLRAEGEAA